MRPGFRSGNARQRGSTAAGKDIWDKISALTIPFVTLVVGAVGTYATWSYNHATLLQRQSEHDSQAAQQKYQYDKDAELRSDQQKSQERLGQAQLLQQLFAFVSSNDPQKREFGYAMFAAMGQGQLAAKLVALKGDKAGISVLKSLVRDRDSQVSKTASAGLVELARLENATSVGNTVVLRQRSSCRDFVESGFKTSRVAMERSDVSDAAKQLDVEPAVLTAFMEVMASASLQIDQ